MGFWAAAAPAIGAIGGSLLSGAFSSAQAARQIDFQREAMQNKHQWAVKDLKAAGLNPILSATYGGQSTPAGAMGQIPDLGASLGTAFQIKRAREQVKTERTQQQLNTDLSYKAWTEAKLNERQENWIATKTWLDQLQLPQAELNANAAKALLRDSGKPSTWPSKEESMDLLKRWLFNTSTGRPR